MNTYAAFIRGIMPTNPNMSNANLREVFEGLGFSNVQTIISSGNVVFQTKPTDTVKLEEKIEAALNKNLGISGVTFVRDQEELESMITKDPFKGGAHSRATYLIVTFLKDAPREVFNALDLSKGNDPKFMSDLEKKHGKINTTRTWKTIERVVAKMQK